MIKTLVVKTIDKASSVRHRRTWNQNKRIVKYKNSQYHVIKWDRHEQITCKGNMWKDSNKYKNENSIIINV